MIICLFMCLQYNLETEPTGIRTFHSELRVIDNDSTGLDMSDDQSITSVTRTIRMTKDGSDIINMLRTNGQYGVQTVVSEATSTFTPKERFLQSKNVVDPHTGHRLKLSDAISLSLIEVTTWSFVEPKSGRHLSLEEAVREGFVSSELSDELQQSSGLRDPSSGRDMTMAEALQKGFIDSATGNITDPRSGVVLSPLEAVERGLISSDLANRLSQADILTQSTRLTRGYYGAANYQSTDLHKLSLHDAVVKGLYDEQSGYILEPVSRTPMSVDEAIRMQILDPNLCEVFDQRSQAMV